VREADDVARLVHDRVLEIHAAVRAAGERTLREAPVLLVHEQVRVEDLPRRRPILRLRERERAPVVAPLVPVRHEREDVHVAAVRREVIAIALDEPASRITRNAIGPAGQTTSEVQRANAASEIAATRSIAIVLEPSAFSEIPTHGSAQSSGIPSVMHACSQTGGGVLDDVVVRQ
jgi:hypothetical protein